MFVCEGTYCTANHKEQASQVNDFSAMRRYKSLASLKIFLRYTTKLSEDQYRKHKILLFSITDFSQNPPSGQLETDDLIFVELQLWAKFFIYWSSREHSLSTDKKKKLRWGGV